MLQAIILKYHPDWLKEDEPAMEDIPVDNQEQKASTHKHHKHSSKKNNFETGRGKPFKTIAPHNRDTETEDIKDGAV